MFPGKLASLVIAILAGVVDVWLFRALLAFVDNAQIWMDVAGFLILHGTVTAVAAMATVGIFSSTGGRDYYFALLLGWSLMFIVPVAGIFGVAAILYLAESPRRALQPRRSRYSIRTPATEDKDGIRDVKVRNDVSEGRLAGVLGFSSSEARKQQAVLDTVRLEDKQSVPLLKKALLDNDDDVRLLAYALLERKEKNIVRGIKEAEGRLSWAAGAEKLPLFRKVIQSYWEFINLGLAQGDVRRHLAHTALGYAEQALAIDPGNAGLLYLQGKLRLELGEYHLAELSFQQAGENGIDDSRIRGYLAEIAYRQHRFGDVSRQLDQIRVESGPSVLQDIKVQWQKDETATGISG